MTPTTAPRLRPFTQVDVFSAEPYRGNPLAVVLDAGDLDADAMQRFANWTNLSETTFLLPPTHPDADYRVRIFTGSEEFPFAGHPTLGSAHAWLEAAASRCTTESWSRNARPGWSGSSATAAAWPLPPRR